jgi:hypothetical protein
VPVDPRDLRSLVAEIRGALDTHSKETVAEILTYVFKEYVVEGPLPLAANAANIVEARSEIEGMTFAQLISWLQLHHDAPELALFDVQGERVQVRVGGRLTPLEAQAARPEPTPPPQPVAPSPPVAPAPSVGAPLPSPPMQSAQPRMPVSNTPPVQTSPSSPRPAAGSSSQAAPQAAQPAAGSPAQPGQAQPAAGQAQPAQKQDEAGDSSRFSLLEVD